jgi:competence protein ComEA
MQPNTPPWRLIETPGTSSASATPIDGGRGIRQVQPPVSVALALALAGTLLLVAFAVATFSDRGAVEIRTAAMEATATAPGGSPAASPAQTIIVDVAGAVVRPGVYTFPLGARVGEAIAAAGGYGPRVDADSASRNLNLAALLRDGDRVRVPSRDDPQGAATPPGGQGGATEPGRLLNLNEASSAELEALPGIGPATVAKILAARAERPFARVDELLERKLVTSKVLEGIRRLVTAG